MFAAHAATAQTVKVPGPVKVWILSFPEVVIVPPVATTNAFPLSLDVESIVLIQPWVESTYTNVTDWPFVFKDTSAFTPPILSVPFGETIKALLSQVAA